MNFSWEKINDSYKDKVVLTVLYLKFCTELSQWHRFSSKQSTPEGTGALITHARNALSAPNSVTNCTVKTVLSAPSEFCCTLFGNLKLPF